MSVEVFVYPISALIAINIFYPFLWTLKTDDYMFSLPLPFILGIYLASFFLFGYTIYLGDKIGNNDIYYGSIFLVVTNILWGMTFDKNSNWTIILLFGSLLLGYITYNEIFLSELTDGGTTLWLNLYSTYIIFIGFMIAVTIEKFRDNKTYNLQDRSFKKRPRKFILSR